MNNPEFEAVNESKGERVVVSHVAPAGTSGERRRGLLGREHLDPEEGLNLGPCQWVYIICRVRFPIDVAFLAGNGRVLAVYHRLKPNRLPRISLPVESALELAAGRLRETKTEIGDICRLRDGQPCQQDTANAQ